MINSLSTTPAQATSAPIRAADRAVISGQSLHNAVTATISALTQAAAAPAPAAKPQPNARLTIEENADGWGYVYKLVDRFTGKIISQAPREQIADLAANETYSAEQVLRSLA